MKNENKIIKLAIHGGIFHADDVFVAAVFQMMARLMGAGIEISRIFQVDSTWDVHNVDPFKGIVADIGGGLFDHHDEDHMAYHFDGTPMAAIGKVWMVFGEQFCGLWLEVNHCDTVNPKRFAKEIERGLIIGLSASDNGVIRTESDPSVLTVASMIGQFRPTWKETDQTMDEGFSRAVGFAENVLNNMMKNIAARLEAEAICIDVFSQTKNGIAVFEQYVPWKNFALMNEMGKAIDYVIYPSLRGGFNCESMPVKGERFKQKKPFPESWRGLSGEALIAITGVNDSVFCHVGGFLIVSKSLDGAIALAKLSAVEWEKNVKKENCFGALK